MAATPVFHREPIFWTTTQHGYNDADRTRRIMVDGRLVTERIPQRGHLGDYEERMRAPGIRFLTMVRHDGHEVSVVFTNGAAHMNHTDSYGQMVTRKSRFFGWFLMGECPCALVAAKTISADTIQCPSNKSAQPCTPDSYSFKKPCPHAIAERDYRRARRADENTERNDGHKTDSAKLLEAMHEQTQALVRAQLKKDK